MPVGADVVVVAIGVKVERVALLHVGSKVASGPKTGSDGGTLPRLAACAVLEVVHYRGD